MKYTTIETAIGRLLIVGDAQGITQLFIDNGSQRLNIESQWVKDDAAFADARQQLLEYAAGERREFHLQLNPKGTDFQHKAWQALQAIPYGQTRSYGQVAAALGNPKASRAVGLANNRNPIPIIIPCHRVVGADGSLTGYAYGVDLKQRLITLEQEA